MIRRLLILPVALLAFACASSPPSPTPPAASAGPKLADGAPCTKGRECASGTCSGACGAGTCVAAPSGCTRDRVAFCGCDDTTFRGSSRCPRSPFKAKGACP